MSLERAWGKRLRCPLCGGKLMVTDTRPVKGAVVLVARRRECFHCGDRFMTYEVRREALREELAAQQPRFRAYASRGGEGARIQVRTTKAIKECLERMAEDAEWSLAKAAHEVIASGLRSRGEM